MKFSLHCLALILLGLTACSQGKTVPTDSGKKIRIFFNNDNISYLEPCGCRVSPIGGMDRRWNAIKAFPDNTRIMVDAGNLLFKSTSATEFLGPQWYEQALGVIEAYNLLGADAVAIGSTEFALGVRKFQELAKNARFPFLSANVYWRGTAKLFLPDSVMVERQGKKIGIFGLFHPSIPLPGELEAKDPTGHAKAMVEKLRGQGADMIIALAHEGFENDRALAREVKGIDLIVGAHSQSLLQEPEIEGETLIVQLSNQGQMLGMVEYDAGSLPKKRTDFVVAELNDEYNNAPSGMANPMKSLLAVTNIRMAEANRKLDERIWAAHKGKRVEGAQTFLACRDCHNRQAEFQEGKLHSAAFLTLLARKKEMNLDCVKCHSVGLGEPGGFRAVKEAFLDKDGQPVPLAKIRELAGGKDFPHPSVDYRANQAQIRPDVARWIEALKKAEVKKAFVGVQCENCHGNLPGHPFAEGAPSPTAVVANTCVQCHTKAQMPAWYDPSGNLKSDKIAAAIKDVACPR